VFAAFDEGREFFIRYRLLSASSSMSHKSTSTFFADNRADAEHGKSSLRGGLFSIGSRLGNVVVQVTSTVWVYRILSVGDVGLVGMVASLTAFAPVLMDLGTRDAAVQKEKITEEEVSALFWLTVGIGLLISICVAVGSPFIAAFYKKPELINIALVSAIAFVISAASCQHTALLRRAMMFRQIAMIELGANFVGSIVSVAMAMAGMGYWSLVVKPIIQAVVMLAGALWYCRWIPGIPRLTEGVREMLRFGLNVTGFTMVDYVSKNADQVAVGKHDGAEELGAYRKAFFVYDNALSLLSVSLHTVAVASLSKLRDNLPELRRAWAVALSTLAFYGMVTFAILAVNGEDIVVLLVGEKWLFAGILLNIVALRGIPHCVERTLGWLHVPAGRADRWARWGCIGTAAHLLALPFGIPFGAVGVAIAYTLTMYFLFVPAIAYAGQPLGIGAKDVLRAVGPQLVGALATALFGFEFLLVFCEDIPRLLRVPLLSAICLLMYFVIVAWLFKVRKPLDVVKKIFREFGPARFRARQTPSTEPVR
jgi:PST family polysaccharide transporter